MALMWRVTVRWSGGTIGAGFTNLFFTEGVGTAQQASDATRAFMHDAFGGSGASLPSAVTMTFPSSLDVMESDNGLLLFSVPVTPGASFTGLGAGVYAAPAGASVTWVTSGVVNGHRVAGRTFLVPMASTAFQNDGTLSGTTITEINAAAAALIAAPPEFAIWHRPESFAAGGGSTHPVLAFKLADKVSVLTSRR